MIEYKVAIFFANKVENAPKGVIKEAIITTGLLPYLSLIPVNSILPKEKLIKLIAP